MPPAPSSSQNRPLHVLDILSTMEPVSNKVLEEEVDGGDGEQNYVSQFSCQFN